VEFGCGLSALAEVQDTRLGSDGKLVERACDPKEEWSLGPPGEFICLPAAAVRFFFEEHWCHPVSYATASAALPLFQVTAVTGDQCV